ncbi:nuclear transport factor 2 family protein [Sphingomonas azotifigens]|uniref:nuclear transport factor 2 family protein n=1 Tax=Sphingomonas azotifigens TaxID=330920 RepID=UPI000A024E7E|nr:nuclear transport factor 2 family protein [Sphingomonas azotifigens]
MQYETSLGRDALIDLAIQKYFAQVDRKNLDAVLDCFHDNAMLTTQTSFDRHVGKDQIRRMFVDLFESWTTIVHKDFVITADVANGRISASFEAVLTNADGQVTRLFNTNFWRIRGDRFQEVYVYMSGANVLI